MKQPVSLPATTPPAVATSASKSLRTAYSLAAAAAAGVAAQPAAAAVRYSTINDISIGYNNFQTLRIDGDNFADIRFTNANFTGGNYQGATVLYAPGRLVGFAPPSIPLYYGKALEAGYMIDSSSSMPDFRGSLAYGAVNPNAEFNNIDNAYIGLSFPIAGNLHYGWVRVSIHNAVGTGTFVIHDWAFNDTPSEGIMAGEVNAPLQGDFNNDLRVDLADYTVWRDNLGADESTDVLSGNGNGGTVDEVDYGLWKANFGKSTFTGDPIYPSSSALLSPVSIPEPATLGLLAAGSLGLALLRRKKTSTGK